MKGIMHPRHSRKDRKVGVRFAAPFEYCLCDSGAISELPIAPNISEAENPNFPRTSPASAGVEEAGIQKITNTIDVIPHNLRVRLIQYPIRSYIQTRIKKEKRRPRRTALPIRLKYPYSGSERLKRPTNPECASGP